MQRETNNLEFKQEVTDTFLKTVSAFANYGTGKIIFGINDNGETIGMKNPKETALKIENKINDSIDPTPQYTIQINADKTIALTIHKGANTPYTYRGKTYRRADSSTVAADRLEQNRLILEGNNQSFENLPAKEQKLTFETLEAELKATLNIAKITLDSYKTLGLYNTDGYNNAAYILADNNNLRGIDSAKFGTTINEIRERQDYSGASIVTQFHEVTEMFHRHYSYEIIEGMTRKKIDTIPTDAFRETIANALIHRAWDINAPIRVSMHPEYIEIVSPGKLPDGISLEEYASGRFSLLRNPILAEVFFRLGYIEKFGTGIARIKHAYQTSTIKPEFSTTENSVTVVLPIPIYVDSLSESAQKILHALADGKPQSRVSIEQNTGIGKDALLRQLAELVKTGAVIKTGNARNTTYQSTLSAD